VLKLSLLQEALRTMEVYQRDFEELIKRIKTQEAFECTAAADNSNKYEANHHCLFGH